MKRIIFILMFLLMIITPARADYFLCAPGGTGSMTYPAAGIGISTGSGWDTSINPSANMKTFLGSADYPAMRVNLGLPLIGGTLTDTRWCRYTAAGTLLNCDVDPTLYATLISPAFTTPNIGTATGTASGDVHAVSNVKTYMGGYVQSVNETSEAATCDWSAGSTCVIAGEANTTAWTLTMSNPVSGQVYRIYVTQQSSGPVPLPTFSPAVTWVSTTPTFSGTNTKHDAITCQYVGTTYFCGLIGNNF